MNWNITLLYAFTFLLLVIDTVIAGTFCYVVYQIVKKLNQRFSFSFSEVDESFPALFRQLAILFMGTWTMTAMLCKYSPVCVLHTSAGFAILFPF